MQCDIEPSVQREGGGVTTAAAGCRCLRVWCEGALLLTRLTRGCSCVHLTVLSVRKFVLDSFLRSFGALIDTSGDASTNVTSTTASSRFPAPHPDGPPLLPPLSPSPSPAYSAVLPRLPASLLLATLLPALNDTAFHADFGGRGVGGA